VVDGKEAVVMRASIFRKGSFFKKTLPWTNIYGDANKRGVLS